MSKPKNLGRAGFAIFVLAAVSALAAEPATTPSISLTEDIGQAVRKKVADELAKTLRDRAAEYQPLLDSLRKRSSEELQKIGQWEYHVVSARTSEPAALAAVLNECGEKGWECFHIISAPPASAGSLPAEHLLVFRKPKAFWLGQLPLREILRLLLSLWSVAGDTPPVPP